jgi:hypothetical protein
VTVIEKIRCHFYGGESIVKNGVASIPDTDASETPSEVATVLVAAGPSRVLSQII